MFSVQIRMKKVYKRNIFKLTIINICGIFIPQYKYYGYNKNNQRKEKIFGIKYEEIL